MHRLMHTKNIIKKYKSKKWYVSAITQKKAASWRTVTGLHEVERVRSIIGKVLKIARPKTPSPSALRQNQPSRDASRNKGKGAISLLKKIVCRPRPDPNSGSGGGKLNYVKFCK